MADWKPSVNPWLIAAAVMLATILEVLDTSVANVAVPHIAGNLSASTDEATWVLTSYLVSNAIVLFPHFPFLSGIIDTWSSARYFECMRRSGHVERAIPTIANDRRQPENRCTKTAGH